jgi:O-antigen/teichoic acid export membrane protein
LRSAHRGAALPDSRQFDYGKTLAMPIGPNDPWNSDTPVSFPEAPISNSEVGLKRLRRIIKILAAFFLGQGALQAVGLMSSLFLVRKLSIEAYAQFGLAFGFQSTVGVLMDLGYASTIIPLVGSRVSDRALVGSYVRSAKHLRDRAFLLITPFAVVAFLAIVYRLHWGWRVQILLLLSVLLSLYASGGVSYYSVPLFLYGKLREFYVPQTLSGLGRLITYIVVQLAGGLNSWTAALLNAMNTAVNGFLLKRESRQCIEWPVRNDPAIDRAMLRYMLPAVPAIVFSAFQGQIALFLISVFGQTMNIAQVAALGKIGQLFAVLTTFNVIIIEPYVARLSRERLGATYLRFLLVGLACSVSVVIVAFVFPILFLWLIGRKYYDLRDLVGWVVLTGCINYLAGLVWIMNRARRWLFWSGTILEIGLTVAIQIAYIVTVGVHSTRGAVLFSLATSLSLLIAHGFVGVYGFLGGPRGIEGS